jgi:hypothetical protein
MRAAVEHASLAALVGLFIAGLVARYMVAAPIWLVGIGTVAALPIMAAADILVDPTSHNLWPIEFVMYAVASLPGLLGAIVGMAVSPREYPVSGSLPRP